MLESGWAGTRITSNSNERIYGHAVTLPASWRPWVRLKSSLSHQQRRSVPQLEPLGHTLIREVECYAHEPPRTARANLGYSLPWAWLYPQSKLMTQAADGALLAVLDDDQ